MDTKDPFVSLRADVGHALWAGIRLRPEVDIQFRLEPFSKESRRITARLVNPTGVLFARFVTGCLFTMGDLGSDYEHLESLGADLMAITRHIEGISANMENGGGVMLRIRIAGDFQFFRLFADEPGQPHIERWDWFIDPSVTHGDGVPIHVPQLVRELQRLAIA